MLFELDQVESRGAVSRFAKLLRPRRDEGEFVRTGLRRFQATRAPAENFSERVVLSETHFDFGHRQRGTLLGGRDSLRITHEQTATVRIVDQLRHEGSHAMPLRDNLHFASLEPLGRQLLKREIRLDLLIGWFPFRNGIRWRIAFLTRGIFEFGGKLYGEPVAVHAVVFFWTGSGKDAHLLREHGGLRCNVVFEFPRAANVDDDRLALLTQLHIELHIEKLLRHGVGPATEADGANAEDVWPVFTRSSLSRDQTHVQAASRTLVLAVLKLHRIGADQ